MTGLGGTGKTRLAVELARHHVDDFPNGVHFVALPDARTVEQMWTAISESVGVSPGEEEDIRAAFEAARAAMPIGSGTLLTGAPNNP